MFGCVDERGNLPGLHLLNTASHFAENLIAGCSLTSLTELCIIEKKCFLDFSNSITVQPPLLCRKLQAF